MKLRRAAANRLRGGGKLVLALLLLTVTTALPTRVSMLEHVLVKDWLPGGGVETRNYFDVPVEDGVAKIPLAGRERG